MVQTLSRHIFEQQREHFPEARGQFTALLMEIGLAAKIVSQQVNMAGLVNILGETGHRNAFGEDVQKLDEFAHNTFFNALDHTGLLCAMASEEADTVLSIPGEFPCGDYAFNYDPLDGSSNIDANVSVGTIFSIYSKVSTGERGDERDCLQKGRMQICAGYVIYGSSTMLVYTAGIGVYGFTLDPGIGEFLLSHPRMKFPSQEKSKNNLSVNIGNYNYWDQATQQYVDTLSRPQDAIAPYTYRYIGSLVADFHRNLLYGGVFLYPADTKKNPNKPEGKLRLLFEAAPLAFIAEQAGGKATTGRENILDIEPTSIQHRVPLVIGTQYDVEAYERLVRQVE